MNSYDLTFITSPVSEALEEQLLLDQSLEINVGQHSGLHFIMATVMTEDFHTAAMDIARLLEGLGVRIERMDLDLVNQSEIAARCSVTKQAVSRWVIASSTVRPFPGPHTLAGGPLWAWSAVNEWLRCTRKQSFDDACSASPAQVETFNVAWMATAHNPSPAREVDYTTLVYGGIRMDAEGWVKPPTRSLVKHL